MRLLRLFVILIVGFGGIKLNWAYKAGLWEGCISNDHARAVDACTTLAESWFVLPRERGSAFYDRALSYQRVGQYERAIADFDAAIRYGTSAGDARLADAYYGRGVILSQIGDREKSIADYTKAIEFDRRYAAAYFARARQHQQQGNIAAAIADNSSAIEAKPNMADAHYNKGSLLEQQGRRDEAIAEFTTALELDPADGKAYRRRGFLRYGNAIKGDDGALADFARAIELGEHDATLYWYRASILQIAKKDYAGAIADLDIAIKLEPKNGRSYLDRGDAHRALRNYLNAISDYSTARDLKL